jgi:DNA polymerase-3 subunit alpha
MNFIPLQLESNFQMNGSNIRLNELVNRAVDYGYSSLALTDNKMYGVLKFYRACIQKGIKPILGLQITLTGALENQSIKLLLYAKNYEGYQNLLYLASVNSKNPVSLVDMKRNKTGLIAVLQTDYSEMFGGSLEQVDQFYKEWKTIIDEHFDEFYVSLSKNKDINDRLQTIFPLVVVHEVKYLDKDDKDVYDVLRGIFNVTDNPFLQNDISSYHFPQKAELLELYKDFEEAVQNSIRIVEECNVDLKILESSMPTYPVPQNVTSRDYLLALSSKGLEKRLNNHKSNLEKYKKRLSYELNIIHKMGYDDYFLIVWDFVKYAKQKGYLVGPGRGSAAASLVSYCLGITAVDPLQFDLVFERFLNPERISLPDIDMDLPDDKRDDVIRYVRDKYGHNHVASICTFGTFLSKSALRDSARILGVEGILLDQIISSLSEYNTIKEAVKSSNKLRNIISQNSDANHLVKIASRIEGLHRHVSTHAAGIILTEEDIVKHSAIQPGLLDMYQTQYEAKDLESLGLLKIDFLGLRNLTSISKIIDLIEAKEHKKLNIYTIPLNDKNTFQLLQKVETTGIFQLESQGMRRLIGDMQVTSFDDIVTCLALFRPGPMENIPQYIKRRRKEEIVTYPHPVLKRILEPTNGIIVYQEQIIQIAASFAGYSMGEADLLRRAVSKKQENILLKERSNFIKKAKQMGKEEEVSNEIYDYIVKFANYGFNKAHSVAYGMISYWMAYLKANYSKYFIGVLMTSVTGSVKTLREYIFEAYKLGVEILPPSINKSTDIFEPENNNLRFPLLGIKHVGNTAVSSIIEEREKGDFLSFVDVIKRLHNKLNTRIFSSLIYAGAFDEFSHSRKTMIEQLENVIHFTQFGNYIKETEFVMNESQEYSFSDLQIKEKEVLGFNVFVDPLSTHKNYIQKHHLRTPAMLDNEHIGKEIRIVGLIQSIRKTKTKRDRLMAFVTISDKFSQLKGVVFTKEYEHYKDALIEGDVYLLKGKLEERNNVLQFIVKNLFDLSK